ncbi:multidrug resistance protein, MATE family [Desulfotomaculum arcticum]|uniref:Probable multidrug resistance protein NorM n=1 Tax=Desulfotruncus arcticus DSM 17038 TaxID=1121424 RepID=A0A1I2NTP9_9FIRM|nr:MATE family efflux transporter [Desulfotruncus arcticus]SFG07294.1 multidrug resistance protein, MATE family [Desulfotomaculum arcticum] [Desulfotruncus arcticus DSM 17038]
MRQTFSLQEKRRHFLAVLWPILITQLGVYAMIFFNTVMSGNAGADDLAGVAIGASFWMPLSTGITGILLALTPIVAHYMGAGHREKVPFVVLQGAYLAVALALCVILFGALTLKPILNNMHLDAAVRDIALRYLKGLSLGIMPFFVYMVFRCFIEALGQTRVTMLITLTSLPINFLMNYLLIFGKLGFPRLGGVGAGYATAITYWCILLMALYVVHRVEPFALFGLFKKRYAVSPAAWVEHLKLGVPIGCSIFFETSFFTGVTLLMSRYGTATIAAHQAALNFSSMLYMVPLSISMALTITVGFEVGAKRYRDARQYSLIGICIALGMAICCGIGLLLLNERVAGLYTKDLSVLLLTKQFLLFAIFFQLSDAIATPMQGVLRGYKDVNWAFFITLASYWLIGLPLGHILSVCTSWGAFGYWIGFNAGLAMGASCLIGRMISVQRKYRLPQMYPGYKQL